MTGLEFGKGGAGGAGHGGPSGRYEYLKELAFEFAFVLERLGH